MDLFLQETAFWFIEFCLSILVQQNGKQNILKKFDSVI
jgi:hypothetical protein